jgi:alpha-1,2-mannosyltransferase
MRFCTPGGTHMVADTRRAAFDISARWLARRSVVAALGAVFVIGALTGLGLVTGRFILFDFKGDLYVAGRAILHGIDPYRPGSLAAQAATLRSGVTPLVVASPRYPPPVLLAAAPLSLLPFKLAGSMFVALCMGAVVLALRLLGIRDWRCLAVACLSEPTLAGALVGNLSPMLLLGVACAWRWRSHSRSGALAVAATVVAKLWLWPVWVWLLLTKRRRTAALAVVIAAAGLLAAWTAIGFAGIASYPHLISNASYVGEVRSGSIAGGLLSLGLSARISQLGALALAGVLMAVAWQLADGPEGDRRSFGLVVVAALIASPVVWDHYLVVLFAPIALLAPRFSLIWLVPALATFSGPLTSRPSLWHGLPDLAAELIVIAWMCLPLPRRETIDAEDRHATSSDAMVEDAA